MSKFSKLLRPRPRIHLWRPRISRDKNSLSWKLYGIIWRIEESDAWYALDRFISWPFFRPKYVSFRARARFHRTMWILSTKLYRRMYAEAQNQYKLIPLSDLYVDDYYIPYDIRMHSGYHIGE